MRFIDEKLSVDIKIFGKGISCDGLESIRGSDIACIYDAPEFVDNIRPVQSRIDDVGVYDVGVDNIRIDDVRIDDVGIDDVGINDVRIYDVGINDVGIYDVGIYDIRVYDVGVYDIRIDDVGINNVWILDWREQPFFWEVSPI